MSNKDGMEGAAMASSKERGWEDAGSGTELCNEGEPAEEASCGQQDKSLPAGTQEGGVGWAKPIAAKSGTIDGGEQVDRARSLAACQQGLDYRTSPSHGDLSVEEGEESSKYW